jgi:alkylhydroperoxidase family enzyme
MMRVVMSIVLMAGGVAVPCLAAAQTTVDAPGARRPAARSVPRVAPLAEEKWTAEHRALVEKFARYGAPDNAFKTFLHVPAMVDGVMPYTIYLSLDTGLMPRHRELLILRAAWLCGNDALWSRHAARARAAGMTAAELRRVAQGPSAAGWDPFEATLLKMADELYRNSSVSDATWATLGNQYTLTRLVEAAETVNHFTVLAMLYNTFGVQPESGATDRLPSDVPYTVGVPPREPPLARARIAPPAGRGLAVTRTFAMHPDLNRNWSPRQTFILQRSPLTPRHREMLILRMGWNCRSEYEWAQHVGVVGRAREHGLEPRLIALGPGADGWQPIERTILTAADELYRDAAISDATWKTLVGSFDTAWAMSAAFTASGYRAISMSLNTYGVQLEPTDERFPSVGR